MYSSSRTNPKSDIFVGESNESKEEHSLGYTMACPVASKKPSTGYRSLELTASLEELQIGSRRFVRQAMQTTMGPETGPSRMIGLVHFPKCKHGKINAGLTSLWSTLPLTTFPTHVLQGGQSPRLNAAFTAAMPRTCTSPWVLRSWLEDPGAHQSGAHPALAAFQTSTPPCTV
jgi:hypothetical protein